MTNWGVDPPYQCPHREPLPTCPICGPRARALTDAVGLVVLALMVAWLTVYGIPRALDKEAAAEDARLRQQIERVERHGGVLEPGTREGQ